MTRFLLAAVLAAGAATMPAAPGGAVDRPGMAKAATAANVTVHRGGSISPGFVSGNRFDHRFDRRRDRGYDNVGYLAVPEYQGDSAWRPDSFNDWWHSRPDRNEPR